MTLDHATYRSPSFISCPHLSTQTVTLGEHDVRKSCDCKGGVCNPRHQGWIEIDTSFVTDSR